MRSFRVWAPTASRVELVIGTDRRELTAAEAGWWVVNVESDQTPIDYGFAVDGDESLPDPRSCWQPYGVNGASRTLDHNAFRWSDHNWQAKPLRSAIIYELHVGTFTPEGSFDAAIEKLDHLVGLGVTHVELMPVCQFSGQRGWGYDGVDLYAPHQAYGGPDGLKRLVDACHARGLAVVLDVVYNHLGPAGNYLKRFSLFYFTERHSTPWGPAINFDGPRSDEVRRFFCDNALMWLRDYHFDGLRLDAVHAIVDTSAVHFLEQLACEVAQLEAELGRHLALIAESDLNDPRVIWARERGGYGIDAQWSDDFHHALHTVLTGERNGYYSDYGSLAALAKALERGFVYDGNYSAFRQRCHGRPLIGVSAHSLLGYMQNHDQIGNRAQGERAGHLMSVGRLKLAAALVLTSPFVPMLFQGEEWGASSPFQFFTDYEDSELGAAVTEGRRREFAAFGWNPEEIPDPQAAETFIRSKLNWDERTREPQAGLLRWHRRLIALRREFSALSDGRFDRLCTRFDEGGKWLVIERGPVVVACNLAEKQQRLPVETDERTRVLLKSEDDIEISNGIDLPAESVAILNRPERHQKRYGCSA